MQADKMLVTLLQVASGAPKKVRSPLTCKLTDKGVKNVYFVQ